MVLSFLFLLHFMLQTLLRSPSCPAMSRYVTFAQRNGKWIQWKIEWKSKLSSGEQWIWLGGKVVSGTVMKFPFQRVLFDLFLKWMPLYCGCTWLSQAHLGFISVLWGSSRLSSALKLNLNTICSLNLNEAVRLARTHFIFKPQAHFLSIRQTKKIFLLKWWEDEYFNPVSSERHSSVWYGMARDLHFTCQKLGKVPK